jgi:hypothetical protein
VRHASKRLQEHGADFVNEKEIKFQSTDIIDNSVNLRRSERNKGKAIQYFPEAHIEITSSEHN